MRPVQAWKKLGIGKTTDRREIKRAYAGKLKAIDPDRDPEAFLSLREALEVALWQADVDLWEENNPDGDDDYNDDYKEHEDRGEPEHAEPSTDPVVVRRHRLAEILWGDMPIQPLEAEAVELAGFVLDDVQMENIEYRSEIEDWFGWLVANTIRRSDCVIPMVVGYFGWKGKIGSINSSYEIEAVVSRYNDLVCLEALKNENHIDHASFVRFSESRSEPIGFTEKMLHGPDLKNFLNRIRTSNPTVEWEFDERTVAMWVDKFARIDSTSGPNLGGCTWYTWLFAAWFVFTVMRTLFS